MTKWMLQGLQQQQVLPPVSSLSNLNSSSVPVVALLPHLQNALNHAVMQQVIFQTPKHHCETLFLCSECDSCRLFCFPPNVLPFAALVIEDSSADSVVDESVCVSLEVQDALFHVLNSINPSETNSTCKSTFSHRSNPSKLFSACLIVLSLNSQGCACASVLHIMNVMFEHQFYMPQMHINSEGHHSDTKV